MSASANGGLVVKDACVFFDLIDLGLLESFYKLPHKPLTTPQVLDEITDTHQLSIVNSYVASGELQVDHWGQLDTIALIAEENHGLSFTDASVIEVASRRDAIIVSSDKGLRNESQRRGLMVRGILWIIEELYKEKIVSLDDAIIKLSKYSEINRRAPLKEIQVLIDRLRLLETRPFTLA